MERPRQLYSSESIGLFGTADHLLSVNDYALSEGLIDGFELMAFRPTSTLQRMIQRIEQENLLVDHFHCRTGGQGRDLKDTVKLFMANQAIVSSSYMIEQMATGKGILFHTPEASSPAVRHSLAATKDISKVWIENHHGPHAIEDMLQLIRTLRADGIYASGMFDVCHYIGAENLTHPKHFDWAYRHMIEQLGNLLTYTDTQNVPLIEGIHLPMGREPDDSLPVSILRQQPQLLQALGDTIAGNIGWVVVEYQENFFTKNFYLLPHQRHEQAAMKRDVTKLLADTGLLVK